MDILSEVYYKSAADNERNLRFWQDYLQNLHTLDLNIFSDKLKVPTLIPIGSRILFRGEIQHTNEVTVALGADYFVKCSVKQAEVLRQHRIKDAQSKVDMYNKEKEYLENQMLFTKKTVYDNEGQEIIEYYNEDEDKAWREKHRENVRQYKQIRGKEESLQTEHCTDEELWNRLEELELQEELENELSDNSYESQSMNKFMENNKEAFVVKAEDYMKINNEEIKKTDTIKVDEVKEIKPKKVSFEKSTTPEQPSTQSILQQVIDKQIELEEKLIELKNRDGAQSKTEADLISRLDELEQLDELEDEMDRLDGILENDLEEEEHSSNETKATKLERRVSFVDEDDSETLNLTFIHSPIEPKTEPYDPSKGIQKPSDIYEAHSKLFGNGTTSILKKSKYEAIANKPEVAVPKVNFDIQNKDAVEPPTIIVKDIVEKVNQGDHKLESQARPTSLFKKKRMQSKS